MRKKYINKFSIGDLIFRKGEGFSVIFARVEDFWNSDFSDEELVYKVTLMQDGRVTNWAIALDDEDHVRVIPSFVGLVPV
jgi:hypothetical protein